MINIKINVVVSSFSQAASILWSRLQARPREVARSQLDPLSCLHRRCCWNLAEQMWGTSLTLGDSPAPSS